MNFNLFSTYIDSPEYYILSYKTFHRVLRANVKKFYILYLSKQNAANERNFFGISDRISATMPCETKSENC